MKKIFYLLVNHLPKIIGCILLIPPIISVILFLLGLIDNGFSYQALGYLSKEATGPGGEPIALLIYLGLMALAGAYLIKDSKK